MYYNLFLRIQTQKFEQADVTLTLSNKLLLMTFIVIDYLYTVYLSYKTIYI